MGNQHFYSLTEDDSAIPCLCHTPVPSLCLTPVPNPCPICICSGLQILQWLGLLAMLYAQKVTAVPRLQVSRQKYVLFSTQRTALSLMVNMLVLPVVSQICIYCVTSLTV